MGQTLATLGFRTKTPRIPVNDVVEGTDVWRLPPEVLDDIIDLLPPASVLACLRVNSAFYGVIYPRLCRRLVVTERDGKLVGTGYRDLAKPTARRGPTDSEAHPDSGTTRYFPWAVRHVEIGAHPTSACTHTPRIWPPGQVASVRLDIATVNGRQRFHVDRDTADAEADHGPCAALAHLTPQTLVVARIGAYFRGMNNVLTAPCVRGVLQPPASSRVRDLYFTLDDTFMGPKGSMYNTLFLNAWPLHAIDRITIVLLTPPGGMWLPCSPRDAAYILAGEALPRWLDRLLRTFVLSFLDIVHPHAPRARLRLVNAGSIDPRALGETELTLPTTQAVAHAVEQRFLELWPRVVPPSLQAKLGHADIGRFEFVGMDEFVTAPEARDVLGADVVAAWRAGG